MCTWGRLILNSVCDVSLRRIVSHQIFWLRYDIKKYCYVLWFISTGIYFVTVFTRFNNVNIKYSLCTTTMLTRKYILSVCPLIAWRDRKQTLDDNLINAKHARAICLLNQRPTWLIDLWQSSTLLPSGGSADLQTTLLTMVSPRLLAHYAYLLATLPRVASRLI